MNRLVVSVAEAATMLGLSRRQVYRHIETGAIPAVKLGKRTVISVAELERIAREGC